MTQNIKVFPISGSGSRPHMYLAVKPVLDGVCVLLAVPFVLPLVAVLALVIMRDGGPAFYSQLRVGRRGRLFRMWKLRSMITGADQALCGHLASDPVARAEWDSTQKLRDDPRITRIGRFLRRSSLDELPQLWNILLGDMALVGPRPMLPEQAGFYPGQAYYRMRPGLTGLWQISRRGQSAFRARGTFDTIYESSMGFRVDMQILFRTLAVVWRGTGC